MKATRLVLALGFLGLVVGCEPDPAGPGTDAVKTAPTQALHAPMFGLVDSNNGAVIHKGEIGCQLVDGEGNWFPGDWSLPCKVEIATYSENLNALLVVEATGVPNPTGKTVHWGPFNPGPVWADSYLPDVTEPPYPCYLWGTDYSPEGALYTVHWEAWVTPSGHAKLICQYQKKWEFQWPG